MARALGGLPAAMDWLATQAPAEGCLFGDTPVMADWTLACLFRVAALAGWTPDDWPVIGRWIDRVQALPAFAATVRIEQILLTTPRGAVREALTAAGVRLTETSYGGREASPSLMGFA